MLLTACWGMAVVLYGGLTAECATIHACADAYTVGHWVQPDAGAELSWHPFAQDCQIFDGIRSTVDGNFSVFSFGDSVDFRLVIDVCTASTYGKFTLRPHESASPYPEFAGHGFDSFATCVFEAGFLYHAYVLGVSQEEQFHMPDAHSKRSAKQRLQAARRDFAAHWSSSPDVIVFSCNFWDNFRMAHDKHGITDLRNLALWRKDLAELLDLIDDTFPATKVKIFHTSAYNIKPDLPQPVVHDLNMAATSCVMNNRNWVLLDLTRLTNVFQHRQDYLRDMHHPKPYVLLTLYNLYISLLKTVLKGSDHDYASSPVWTT